MTGLFGAAPEPMSLWAMLGGGLLAFVSPCVLPMLPVYAMYLLGGTDAAPGRLLRKQKGQKQAARIVPEPAHSRTAAFRRSHRVV